LKDANVATNQHPEFWNKPMKSAIILGPPNNILAFRIKYSGSVLILRKLKTISGETSQKITKLT
jgi:hypothetical protein